MFDGFDRVWTGCLFIERFDRSNCISFKEELKTDVFAIMVEPGADASFFDVVYFAGDIAFFEEQGFGREGVELPEMLKLLECELELVVHDGKVRRFS